MSETAPVRVTRFGAGAIADLGEVAAAVGITRPVLVATRRGVDRASQVERVATFDGVRPHAPVETVEAALAIVREHAADGLVGLGGGSAIDTCKAVVARLADAGVEPVPRVLAIPTTYAGAEWTPSFGTLLAPGRKGGGTDARATPVGAVYDPELSVGLPLEPTVGTSMNALAHCAEAYYHPARGPRAERHAETGATAIGHALPLAVRRLDGIYERTRLLEGAMRAALALADSGACLAHAMAQALGGRYGQPQGTMNALCLSVALRFNAEAVPEAIARFGAALDTDDAPARVAELAALGGFGRLRDYDVPEKELADVAKQVVARPGARANPRPASAREVEELLREIW